MRSVREAGGEHVFIFKSRPDCPSTTSSQPQRRPSPTAVCQPIMAPTHLGHSAAHAVLNRLFTRAASTSNNVPLASVFALVGSSSSSPSSSSISSYRLGSRALSDTLEKRQQYILAIPTTYDNINSSPAPGAIAGITLGAVGGFVLILFLVLLILRQYTGRSIVEKEIIETHHHHRGSRRSRSRSSRGRTQMSERQRVKVRQETRIERSVSRPAPESVVVEEQDDDVVEVIEEHSPERPQRKKSGYRTVDPAEFGGGSDPRRKLGRR